MLRKIYYCTALLFVCALTKAQDKNKFLYAGTDINGTDAYAYLEKDLGDIKEVWERYIIANTKHDDIAARPLRKVNRKKIKNTVQSTTETYYNYMQYDCKAGTIKALRQIKTTGTYDPVLIKDHDFSTDEIIKTPEKGTNIAYIFAAICGK